MIFIKRLLRFDFTDYLHSSGAFYQKGIKHYDKLLHVNEVLL